MGTVNRDEAARQRREDAAKQRHTQAERESIMAAKIMMFMAAMATWVAIAVIAHQALAVPLAYSIGFGLLCAFAYPFFGALATMVSEGLYRWAFNKPNPWAQDNRLFCGAFWPVTLIWHVVVSIFFGLINGLFSDK